MRLTVNRQFILPIILAAALCLGAGAPKGGPYFHRVESATSRDGLQFERDGKVLREHASVPCALVRGSEIFVYFVDAGQVGQGPHKQETVKGIVSKDSGKSWEYLDVQIEGLSGDKAVDPSAVLLPDGRIRLYYYSVRGRIDSEDDHAIASAVSSDGVNFEEEGRVFAYPGLVDPDVFKTDSGYEMYVFSLSAHGTVVADSRDGKTFEYKGMHPLQGYGTVAPVRLPDGRWRQYAFEQPSSNSIVSFVSGDLESWETEPGERLTVAKDEEITDPFVVRLPDGRWKMFFKITEKGIR